MNLDIEPRRPEVSAIWWNDKHEVCACDSAGDWVVIIIEEQAEPIDC